MVQAETLNHCSANMPEVMKTRLQLQGELQKVDANAPRVYKNVLDVFRKTWRNEGIRGLQRGLLPAVSLSISSRVSAATPMRLKWPYPFGSDRTRMMRIAGPNHGKGRGSRDP